MNNSTFSALLLFSRFARPQNWPIVWFHQRFFFRAFMWRDFIQCLYFANFLSLTSFNFHNDFSMRDAKLWFIQYLIYCRQLQPLARLFFIRNCRTRNTIVRLSFLATAIHIAYNTVLFGNWTIQLKWNLNLCCTTFQRTEHYKHLFIFCPFTLLK